MYLHTSVSFSCNKIIQCICSSIGPVTISILAKLFMLLRIYLIRYVFVRHVTYNPFLNIQFIPEGGITVYANLLHTHTVGECVASTVIP